MGLEILTDWQSSSEQYRNRRVHSRDVDSLLDDVSLCLLQIIVNDRPLTKVKDTQQEVHEGPCVSAYALAEWLIWNWWRLRWEPSPKNNSNPYWRQAHETTSIGGGWVWPRIVFDSDGQSVAVKSYGSEATATEPLSYLNDDSESLISASDFEECIDLFISNVTSQLGRLASRKNSIRDMRHELAEERENTELSSFRRIEALLGNNPDEGDESIINRLQEDHKVIGRQSVDELASAMSEQHTQNWDVLCTELLNDIALREGLDVSEDDSPMSDNSMTMMKSDPSGVLDAWIVGKEAAIVMRQSERIVEGPLSNRVLTDLCSLPQDALAKPSKSDAPFSYMWSYGQTKKIVFNEMGSTNKRISSARLLGDKQLVSERIGALRPVTDTNTFRQKIQRSFATELLCPSDALTDRIGTDYSAESIENTAKYFDVTPDVISTSLKNNLERPDFSSETQHSS